MSGNFTNCSFLSVLAVMKLLMKIFANDLTLIITQQIWNQEDKENLQLIKKLKGKVICFYI